MLDKSDARAPAEMAKLIELAYLVVALCAFTWAKEFLLPIIVAGLVSLLLAPVADEFSSQKKGLVNTVAALTELNHFSTPDVRFSARYDDREGNIVDPDPPFSRTIILGPSPETPEENSAQEVADLAGDYLFRDLSTPL